MGLLVLQTTSGLEAGLWVASWGQQLGEGWVGNAHVDQPAQT